MPVPAKASAVVDTIVTFIVSFLSPISEDRLRQLSTSSRCGLPRVRIARHTNTKQLIGDIAAACADSDLVLPAPYGTA
jgi:hypothetical protein